MPDDFPELPPGGIDIHPEFVEQVMPHVKSASEWILHGETVVFYVACHEKRPDLIVRMLELCDGDLDWVLHRLEGTVWIAPVITGRLESALDAIDTHLSRWPKSIRARLVSYIMINLDRSRGLNHLLERYEPYGKDLIDFVVRYPKLAGVDPNVLIDAMDVSAGWATHDAPGAWVVNDGTGSAWMHEFVELVSVFGCRWREWVDACDPGIEGSELIGRVHVAAHVAGLDAMGHSYDCRTEKKGLAAFLLANRKRLPGYALRLVTQHWKEASTFVRSGDVDGAIDAAVQHVFGTLDRDISDISIPEMRLAAASGLHWMDLRRIRRVREEAEIHPPPPWTEVGDVKVGRYEGVFLTRGDVTVPYIGSIVGCCQHLGGAAKLCAIHSAVSPVGAVFVVRLEGSSDPIAMSWVWSRDGVVVFDNIEGPVVRGRDSRLDRVVLPMYEEVAERMVAAGHASAVTLGVDKVGMDRPQAMHLDVWPHTWPTHPGDYLEIFSSWGDDLGTWKHERRAYPTDSCLRKLLLAGEPPDRLSANPFVDLMDDPSDTNDVLAESRKMFPDGDGGPCGPSSVAALLGMKIRDVMSLWPTVVGSEFPWRTTSKAMMKIVDAVGLDAQIERVELDSVPEPPAGAAVLACVRLYPEMVIPNPMKSIHRWHWVARVGDVMYPHYSWVPVDLAEAPAMSVRRVITVRRRSS